MKAVPSADHNTVFVEAGCVCLRNPDGSPQPAVPLFLAVDAAEVTGAGITRSEGALCEEIGKTLAKKYGKYMRAIRAVERHQRKGEQNEQKPAF